MKTIIAIAAAFLAVPAVAQDQSQVQAATAVAPASTGGSAAKVKPTRYCYQDDVTGSRIQRKECKTREQWLARGFDPLKK
ncbi:MAG TPA: hypothetical protein VF636_06215 [Sphingomonas sp.]